MESNNATAVADPEQQQPTDVNAAQSDQTPPDSTPAPSTPSDQEQVNGEGAGEQSPLEGGEAEADGGFEAAFAKVKGKAAPKSEDKQLPGRSLDDENAEIESRRATRYAELINHADRNEVLPYLREELGFSEQDANAIWQKIRPVITDVHANNQAHNVSMLNSLLRASLSDDEKEILDKRSYYVRDEQGRVKPYSSMNEGLKLVLAAREERVNKEWQDKVESGEYLSREDAEKVAEAMIAVERSKWERTGSSSSSGQTINGQPSSTKSDPARLEELAMKPNLTQAEFAEMKAIRDRQEGRG